MTTTAGTSSFEKAIAMATLLINLEITDHVIYTLCDREECHSDIQPGEPIYRFETFNSTFLLCEVCGKQLQNEIETLKKTYLLGEKE